jgi:hypothetical protein
MGQKNADRIPVAFYRASVVNVADMMRHRWDVVSKCTACGLLMQLDLALVARPSGPKAVLWNRKQRCRRIGCQGFVEFQARPPGAAVYQSLTAEDGQ